MSERGSFHDLNTSDGFVSSLGLKKSEMDKAAAADAESVEIELAEKEAVLAKVTSIKAMEAEQAKEKAAPSRGKRNAAALFTYIRSMGNLPFAVFCIFTVANIGFRSSQRE